MRDFGCNGVGDVDDTPFVVAALEAMGSVDTTDLPGNRGRLFFPPGKYKLDTPIHLERRCDIEGATAGGVTIECADYSTGFIFHSQLNSPRGGASDQSRISNIDFIGGPRPDLIAKWQPKTVYAVTEKIVPRNAACPKPLGAWWSLVPAPKVLYADSPYSWEYYYECISSTGAGESADVDGIALADYLALALDNAHPWLPAFEEEHDVSVIKLPPASDLDTQLDTDRVFFACTDDNGPGSVTSSALNMPDFYGQVVGVEFSDNDVKWTPFRTNEPDWRTAQCPDDSVEYDVGLVIAYGAVVRAYSRWDAVFLCVDPDVGVAPITTTLAPAPPRFQSYAMDAANNTVFGDRFTDGDGITWECWPTGAELEPAAYGAGPYTRGDKVLSPAGRRYVCETGGAVGGGDPFPGPNDPDPSWSDPLIVDGACRWRAYAPIASMILDNDLVWSCRVSSAIRVMAPWVEIANCSMTTFPNAGIHIQADSASATEPGLGIVPPANANEWTIRKVLVQQCGAGILARAGDANDGRGYDISITGQTGETAIYPEERGIADRSFLGCRWYAPFVQNLGGPGFWVTSPGSTGVVEGGYFEFTGYLDVIANAYTALGGGVATGIRVFGQPETVANITKRSPLLAVLPSPVFCRNLVELGSLSEENERVQFRLAHLLMDPDTNDDGWYAWVWQRGATGWWACEYASIVWASPLGLSSASAAEGPGLLSLPRGFFAGEDADRFYLFPSRLASQQGKINGGRRNLGDRRVLAVEAAPGKHLEEVVTSDDANQLDGVPWSVGDYYSGNATGDQKFDGDTVVPTDTSNRNVFRCTASGTSTAEPNWALAPNLDDPFTDADGIQWKNVGTQPVWSKCNRIHGGQITLDFAGGNVTLTEDEAAHDIVFADNFAGARSATFPTPADEADTYQRTIRNNLGGTLTVGLAAGATVALLTGKTAIVGFEPGGAFQVTPAF